MPFAAGVFQRANFSVTLPVFLTTILYSTVWPSLPRLRRMV